jgi:hypothetical protein
MCGVVQNLERSAAGWLRGFDLVRYTTAIENEQQFCPDRITFHLISNAAHSEGWGEIISIDKPGASKQKFRQSISAFHRPAGKIFGGGRFQRAVEKFRRRPSSRRCW